MVMLIYCNFNYDMNKTLRTVFNLSLCAKIIIVVALLYGFVDSTLSCHGFNCNKTMANLRELSTITMTVDCTITAH